MGTRPGSHFLAAEGLLFLLKMSLPQAFGFFVRRLFDFGSGFFMGLGYLPWDCPSQPVTDPLVAVALTFTLTHR